MEALLVIAALFALLAFPIAVLVNPAPLRGSVERTNQLLSRVSSDLADVRRDIFKKLAARNYPILMMRSNELSLEEVFLKLTTGDEYGGAEKLETKFDSISKGADEK